MPGTPNIHGRRCEQRVERVERRFDLTSELFGTGGGARHQTANAPILRWRYRKGEGLAELLVGPRSHGEDPRRDTRRTTAPCVQSPGNPGSTQAPLRTPATP